MNPSYNSMKNVNNLVITVQKEGTESIAFVDLFTIINAQSIEPKAESFSKQLKGDVDAGISEGYKLLEELVASWDGTGNFHTLFKVSFENRLKNLIKYMGRNLRKHNTSYDISLSESASSIRTSDEPSPILEVLGDESLVTRFDVTEEKNRMEMLLQKFGEQYPEQAGLIELMATFDENTGQSAKTNAYCEYFGVQTYTSVIQKRVSRARESFKKFLLKNNYQLSF